MHTWHQAWLRPWSCHLFLHTQTTCCVPCACQNKLPSPSWLSPKNHLYYCGLLLHHIFIHFQFTHLYTSFSQLGDGRSSASHSSRVLDGVADVADAFRMTPRSSRYTWSIGCSQVLGRPSWMLDKRKICYQRRWVSTRVFATDSSLHKKNIYGERSI